MIDIDMLVSEKVMGWTISNERSPYRWRVPLEQHRLYRDWEGHRATDCPAFSLDISVAWEVVEHLRSNGYLLRMMDQHHATGMWDCRFYKFPDSVEIKYQVAEEAPMAICLAALAAVGVSDTEIQEALT